MSIFPDDFPEHDNALPDLLICGQFTPRATQGARGGLDIAVRDFGLFLPESLDSDVSDICLIVPVPSPKPLIDSMEQCEARLAGARTLHEIFNQILADTTTDSEQRDFVFTMLATMPLCHLVGPETHYLATHEAVDAAARLHALPVTALSYAFQDAEKRRYLFTSVDPARNPAQKVFVPLAAIKGLHSLTETERREEEELIRDMAILPAKSDLVARTRIDFDFGHVLIREPVGTIASHMATAVSQKFAPNYR